LQHTEARAGVPIDRESLHPGCPTGGNLEWHAFSVVNVWRLLDRRTRRPKVMLVPRAAAVPRSTESRPLVRNENRAAALGQHPSKMSTGVAQGKAGGPSLAAAVEKSSRPDTLERGKEGRPVDLSHGSDPESRRVSCGAHLLAAMTSQPRSARVSGPPRCTRPDVSRYHCGQHPPDGCRTWPISRRRRRAFANPCHAPEVMCTVWPGVRTLGVILVYSLEAKHMTRREEKPRAASDADPAYRSVSRFRSEPRTDWGWVSSIP